MPIQSMLSERIGMEEIKQILLLIGDNGSLKQELFDLVVGDDENIGFKAAWVFSHFSSKENEWLYDKQDLLIDEAMSCNHGGKRRVILTLLLKQPFPNPPRVDFLDYCIERMMSVKELPGVKAPCMKIAYELCLPIPELLQELKMIITMMDGDLAPYMQSVKNKVLKAMEKGRSLRMV